MSPIPNYAMCEELFEAVELASSTMGPNLQWFLNKKSCRSIWSAYFCYNQPTYFNSFRKTKDRSVEWKKIMETFCTYFKEKVPCDHWVGEAVYHARLFHRKIIRMPLIIPNTNTFCKYKNWYIFFSYLMSKLTIRLWPFSMVMCMRWWGADFEAWFKWYQ